MADFFNNGPIGKDIKSYAAKLTENKDLKIGQSWTAGDGGNISIFFNSQGKNAGSLYQDKNGQAREVSFETENGGMISYRDDDMNGTIDTETIVQDNKQENGKDISAMAQRLESGNYKLAQTITAGDGGHIYIYQDSMGRDVGSVNKDAAGKIRNVAFDGENGWSSSYNDMDMNGTIDNGLTREVNNGSGGVNVENLLNGLQMLFSVVSKFLKF